MPFYTYIDRKTSQTVEVFTTRMALVSELTPEEVEAIRQEFSKAGIEDPEWERIPSLPATNRYQISDMQSKRAMLKKRSSDHFQREVRHVRQEKWKQTFGVYRD